ncbi:zinc finger protein 3 homolog isoform X2 [Schistocerca serialis cubense]|uniref:zinc finger protein 3 homolog isoform X2 n=1 Tax=Schistocerca serialis cubense TaxID=2023355 RepID=UPI00214E5696|nr:zinc finger protein 3 homolog isoform X2 [Schistocerca serialis cubense]
MDSKGTSWLKKEKNEVYAEPGSFVQLHTSTMKLKEELDEKVNQQFLEGPLKIVMPSLHIKQDLELKQEDGIERDCLEDNLVISWPNDFIKEDPELNLEVAASIRNASDSLSFIQSAGDSCNVSYQEALHQGLVDDDQKIDTEMSTDFSMSHNYTKLRTSHEDSLCGTRLSCSIREKEFHKFNCSFCLQSFPSKYRLIMHIFIHMDGVQAPAYVCKSCGEVLPTDDSLKEHLRMSEGDQALSAANSEKLECSDYHENIISLESVREEIVEQTEKQSSSKETRKTLRKSFSDTSNTLTVTQVAEQLRYDDYGILCTSDHVNVHTVLSAKRRHKCDVCGKLFNRSNSLKVHELIHTGKRPHECHVCGKSFTQSSHLKRHELIHTGKRPIECGVCGKSFILSGSLKAHELIHTGKRPHECRVCGKSFTQSSNLKRHELIHKGKRPHECGVSGKAFTQSGHLKTQNVIHTGKRPHECDVCGKSFTKSRHLKSHGLIHTGKRSYKCTVCGKSFIRSDNLKVHELIHTGTRPHECGVCGKSFTLSGHLKTHLLIHTGKRPHECEVCGKSFTQSGHLKRHLLTHIGKRPYKYSVA